MKENKNSGHFSLFPLLAFVAKNPALPPFLGRGEKRKSTPYRKAVVEVLTGARIPRKAGWYVWGKFNDAGFWDSIYIGKTESGKYANLFTRLEGELREEYPGIYATVFGRYWTATAARKLFKEHARRGGKDWSAGIERSLRKTDTHFIIWAAAPEEMTNKDILDAETALISAFRPGFNIKRPKVEGRKLYEDPRVHASMVALEDEISRIVGEG